jgi:osmotically-inducible protein OsmY
MPRDPKLLLSLLTACTAAAIVTAQAPQTAPPAQPAPPTVDSAAPARERVTASDAQLGLEVQVRLFQELGVSNLSAIVRYGVVTLDGMVRTEADIKRAEELALQVRGVNSVVNELSVAQPLSVAVANDAAAVRQREGNDIEAAVTGSLNADAALGSRSIRVVVDELTNTVTLTGSVATAEEKERAGSLAVQAYPAGQVRNQLEVRQRV